MCRVKNGVHLVEVSIYESEMSNQTIQPIKIRKWHFSILSWPPSVQTFFCSFYNAFWHIQTKNQICFDVSKVFSKMEVS